MSMRPVFLSTALLLSLSANNVARGSPFGYQQQTYDSLPSSSRTTTNLEKNAFLRLLLRRSGSRPNLPQQVIEIDHDDDGNDDDDTHDSSLHSSMISIRNDSSKLEPTGSSSNFFTKVWDYLTATMPSLPRPRRMNGLRLGATVSRDDNGSSSSSFGEGTTTADDQHHHHHHEIVPTTSIPTALKLLIHERAAAVKYGLREIMNHYSRDDQAAKDIWRLGGPVLVVATMEKHSSSARIQTLGCIVLVQLLTANKRAWSKGNRNDVVEVGGVAVVVAAMNRFPNIPVLQLAACEALLRIVEQQQRSNHSPRAAGNVSSTSRGKHQLVATRGVASVMVAMKSHPYHIDLHRHALCTLYEMVEYCDNSRHQIVVDADGIPHLVGILILYAEEQFIHDLACIILVRLTKDETIGEIVKQTILKAGALAALGQAAETAADVLVQERLSVTWNTLNKATHLR